MELFTAQKYQAACENNYGLAIFNLGSSPGKPFGFAYSFYYT